MQEQAERDEDVREEDEGEPKRACVRRRFVMRGGELVEVSAAPVRETR
jgi:hypothetical protein